MSQLKIKDGNSWIDIPAGGIGVPSGGTAGQYLKKSSSTDYATEWASFPSGATEVYSNTESATDISCSVIANDKLAIVIVNRSSINKPSSDGSWKVIGTIPSGYRPVTYMRQSVPGTDSNYALASRVNIRIDPDGKVNVTGYSTGQLSGSVTYPL